MRLMALLFVPPRRAPHLEAPLPSSSSSAASNSSVTPVKMKSSKDITIKDSDDLGKKNKRRKLLPRRQKKWLKKELPNSSPRNTLPARMRPQMSQEPRTRMTLRRISPRLKWIRIIQRRGPCLITTSLARLLQQKSQILPIAKKTPSSSLPPLPPTQSICHPLYMSLANVAITNLPAIASPSAGTLITLTNHQNSHHGSPGDKIVSIYMW